MIGQQESCCSFPLWKLLLLRTSTCLFKSHSNTYTQNQPRSTSPVTFTLPLKLEWVPGTCLGELEGDQVKRGCWLLSAKLQLSWE